MITQSKRCFPSFLLSFIQKIGVLIFRPRFISGLSSVISERALISGSSNNNCSHFDDFAVMLLGFEDDDDPIMVWFAPLAAAHAHQVYPRGSRNIPLSWQAVLLFRPLFEAPC